MWCNYFSNDALGQDTTKPGRHMHALKRTYTHTQAHTF